MRIREEKLNILVTGGAGFIGSTFVRNLLDGKLNSEFDKIFVLDNLSFAGNIENLNGYMNDMRLEFIEGDIRDAVVLDQIISNVSVIYNFAAESHVDRSIQDASDFISSNVNGVFELLKSVLRNGKPRFIQISTDEVYGSISSGSWTEEDILEPNSPYAASKAAAEMVVRGMGKTHNIDYRITRCSNNYGPNQHIEKLIPLFISRLLNLETVPLYGKGLNVRDWIHVDDHCQAIEMVSNLGKSQEIYNIGGGTELSNLDITYMLLSILGLGKDKISFVEDRKGHDHRYSLNSSKIESTLGFIPNIKFSEGLKDTVNWYVDKKLKVL
jgi:dTDP-glucose 4,6-dehydratase